MSGTFWETETITSGIFTYKNYFLYIIDVPHPLGGGTDYHVDFYGMIPARTENPVVGNVWRQICRYPETPTTIITVYIQACYRGEVVFDASSLPLRSSGDYMGIGAYVAGNESAPGYTQNLSARSVDLYGTPYADTPTTLNAYRWPAPSLAQLPITLSATIGTLMVPGSIRLSGGVTAHGAIYMGGAYDLYYIFGDSDIRAGTLTLEGWSNFNGGTQFAKKTTATLIGNDGTYDIYHASCAGAAAVGSHLEDFGSVYGRAEWIHDPDGSVVTSTQGYILGDPWLCFGGPPWYDTPIINGGYLTGGHYTDHTGAIVPA